MHIKHWNKQQKMSALNENNKVRPFMKNLGRCQTFYTCWMLWRADAWNMLYGSAREDWGSEANIDELHNSATAAKHSVDNMSKVRLFRNLLIDFMNSPYEQSLDS